MIIDSDVKFNDARDKGDSDYNDEFELEEEKPQIYFDGNTLLSEHNEKKDTEKMDKWAPIPARNSNILVDDTERYGSLQKHGSSSVERSSPQKYIRKRHDSPDASKEYSRLASLSSPDLSPDRPEKGSSENIARKRQRHDSFDFSPKRKGDKESSPDLSPPRNTNKYSEKNSRRKYHRHDSIDSKESVGNGSSSDLSPERVSKKGSMSTQQGKLHDSMDLSPKRKHNTTDLSPPRRKSHVSPELLPNKLDSRQKRNRHSPDLSPERQKGEHRTRIENNSKKHQRVSPEVITSGKKSGLQSAKSLREENLRTKRLEDEQFAVMEKSLSGQGVTTIYRDKSGKKIDLIEEKRKRDEIEKKKMEDNAKYDKWKKGLKQLDEFKKKVENEWHEMAKPLARYKDDKDLDEMLKQQEREEDPMLAFIKKSKEKSKEKKKEKPRYRGTQPPPNRFNLWPGYRWDGVDRSNGFEKKRFAAIAERQSFSVDAYKWSVEDM